MRLFRCDTYLINLFLGKQITLFLGKQIQLFLGKQINLFLGKQIKFFLGSQIKLFLGKQILADIKIFPVPRLHKRSYFIEERTPEPEAKTVHYLRIVLKFNSFSVLLRSKRTTRSKRRTRKYSFPSTWGRRS